MRSQYTEDLNSLVRQTVALSNTIDELRAYGILIVREEELPHMFLARISREVLKLPTFCEGYVHCARYAAECCVRLLNHAPHHETAFECLEAAHRLHDPEQFREGADLCFAFVALFPKRATRRGMSLAYYQAMGRGLYDSWCYNSRPHREIGRHMAEHFPAIAAATNRALHTLRGPHIVR